MRLDDGTTASGRAVVIATGVQYRKLDVPRLAPPASERDEVYRRLRDDLVVLAVRPTIGSRQGEGPAAKLIRA